LVSYGTRFLREEIKLEDWYEHAIFRGARLQFRRLDDNALLADDFTLWLRILARSGATRLSLHMLAQFDIPMPKVMAWGDYAVVAHYPERYEIWAVGNERAEWLTHPLFPKGENSAFHAFPNAARYGGDLDNYWCVETWAGKLPVPDTQWKELAAAIGRDLDMNVPSSQAPAGPFYGDVAEDAHGRMPLFPKSAPASLASWILSSLDWTQAWYDNDMHYHNDTGSYARASSDEELDRLEDFGTRLRSWTIETLICSANEARNLTLFSNEAPLVRIHTPTLKAASRIAQA
jgi:hypothetical protein